MFADDQTVSKTMIKYACGIPKESIVDVEGVVAVPQNPIESATQKDVSCAHTYTLTLRGPPEFAVDQCPHGAQKVLRYDARCTS